MNTLLAAPNYYQGAEISIDGTASIAEEVYIGNGTRVLREARISRGVRLGRYTDIGIRTFLEPGVITGDNVTLHQGVSIFGKTIIEDGVTIGPFACIGNISRDYPVNPQSGLTRIRAGVTIGAGAIIYPGVTIGRHAIIAPGVEVAQNVPDQAIVKSFPGRVMGYICRCGYELGYRRELDQWVCPACDRLYSLDRPKLRRFK